MRLAAPWKAVPITSSSIGLGLMGRRMENEVARSGNIIEFGARVYDSKYIPLCEYWRI
jgi:hypothetical protein